MYVITVPHITLLIWVNKRIELKIWIELRCWNLSKTYLSYNLSQWYYFEQSISYLWISLELELCGMDVFIFFLVNIIGDFRVQLADVQFRVVVDGQTVNVRHAFCSTSVDTNVWNLEQYFYTLQLISLIHILDTNDRSRDVHRDERLQIQRNIPKRSHWW